MGSESEGRLGEWRFAATPENVPLTRHRRGCMMVEGLGVDRGDVALAVTEAVAKRSSTCVSR